MPYIGNSTYVPPRFFLNPHVQTVFPVVFRVVTGVLFERERIFTPDHDFLDLDWSLVDSRKLVILSHGLEGNSRKYYMLGMAKALNKRGFSVLSWNHRGCSGEINQKEFSYHLGFTHDLNTVVEHALAKGSFDEIVLIGFSLGGNIVLKYVGEKAACLHPNIKKAIAFSTPVDVPSCAGLLTNQNNRIYFRVFMNSIQRKLREKAKVFPDKIDPILFSEMESFQTFDNLHTAPLFGFCNAYDYWEKASSKPYLQNISIPTLLVNAKDDPLLSSECFPVSIAEENPCFHFEMPTFGGHVGFVSFNSDGEYWLETRAARFLTEG